MINVALIVEDQALFEDNPDLQAQAQQVAEQIRDAIKDLGLKEAHPKIMGGSVLSWLQGGPVAEGAARSLRKIALTGSGKAVRSEILSVIEDLEVEPRKKRGAGRPPASPTGERRQEWRISIAPSARKRAEDLAQAEGISPSALVEKLILEVKQSC